MRPPDFYACPVCNRTSDDPGVCTEHTGVELIEVRMGDMRNPEAVPEGNGSLGLDVTQDRRLADDSA